MHRSLEFNNLPLTVVGIRFAILPGQTLDLASCAKLFEGLRSSGFDQMVDSDEVESAPGQSVVFRLGRNPILIRRSQDNVAVKVQPEVLAVQWRSTPRVEVPYPRYQTLREVVVSVFRTLSITPKHVNALNMSYTNEPKLESRSSEDSVCRFISPTFVPTGLQSRKEFHQLELAWRDDDGTDLRLLVQSIQRRSEEPDLRLRLHTVAGRFLEGRDVLENLDAVHDRLQTFFKELITQEAKQEWGYVEHELFN